MRLLTNSYSFLWYTVVCIVILVLFDCKQFHQVIFYDMFRSEQVSYGNKSYFTSRQFNFVAEMQLVQGTDNAGNFQSKYDPWETASFRYYY